jgi:hypothetical protein
LVKAPAFVAMHQEYVGNVSRFARWIRSTSRQEADVGVILRLKILTEYRPSPCLRTPTSPNLPVLVQIDCGHVGPAPLDAGPITETDADC